MPKEMPDIREEEALNKMEEAKTDEELEKAEGELSEILAAKPVSADEDAIRGTREFIKRQEKELQDPATMPERRAELQGYIEENKDRLARLSKASSEIGEEFTVVRPAAERGSKIDELAEEVRRSTPSEIRKYDAEQVEKARKSEEEMAARLGYKPNETEKPVEPKEKTAKEKAEDGIKYWANDLKEAKTESERHVAQKNLEKYNKDLVDAIRQAEGASATPPSPEKPGSAKAEQPKQGQEKKTETAPAKPASSGTSTNRPATGRLFSSSFESASDWFGYLSASTEAKLAELESVPKKQRGRWMKFIKSRFKFGMKQLKIEAKAAKKKGNKIEYESVKARMSQEKDALREFNRGAYGRKLMSTWQYMNPFNSANWWLSNKPIAGLTAQTSVAPATAPQMERAETPASAAPQTPTATTPVSGAGTGNIPSQQGPAQTPPGTTAV